MQRSATPETEKSDPGTQYFLSIKTYTNISLIPKDEWNALLRPDDSPFLEWEWLYCLEEAGCATPETGK